MEIKKTRVSLFVLLFIGGSLIFSFSLFFWLRQGELNIAKEKFSDMLYHYASAVEYAFVDEARLLNALAAYHYGTKFISRDEFKKFSKMLLNKHPNIQAIAWMPEVLDRDREFYEKSARQEGLEAFGFRELDENGAVTPALMRPIYYPVYFLEPLKGNEKAFGLDVGSEKKLLDVVLKAKESGVIIASGPVDLPQVSEKKIGIVVFQPIYISAEDKNSFQGLYTVVIRTGNLIENSVAEIIDKRPGIYFKVYDSEFPDKVIYKKNAAVKRVICLI